MKTADIKFNELCDEIDYWKAKAEYYKQKYEEELESHSKFVNDQLEESKKGVANALMLALSIEDKPDGSISISKENREKLADGYGYRESGPSPFDENGVNKDTGEPSF